MIEPSTFKLRDLIEKSNLTKNVLIINIVNSV